MGIVFTTDLGRAFTWIYRAWFVLVLVVLAVLLRLGKQTIGNVALRPICELAVLGGYVAWIMMLVLFVLRGDDTPNGMVTWLATMVVASSLDAVHQLENMKASQYSVPAALFKFAGNLCTLVFCVMAMRDMGLAITLILTVIVLDAAYIALMLDRRKRERAGLPLGAHQIAHFLEVLGDREGHDAAVLLRDHPLQEHRGHAGVEVSVRVDAVDDVPQPDPEPNAVEHQRLNRRPEPERFDADARAALRADELRHEHLGQALHHRNARPFRQEIAHHLEGRARQLDPSICGHPARSAASYA